MMPGETSVVQNVDLLKVFQIHIVYICSLLYTLKVIVTNLKGSVEILSSKEGLIPMGQPCLKLRWHGGCLLGVVFCKLWWWLLIRSCTFQGLRPDSCNCMNWCVQHQSWNELRNSDSHRSPAGRGHNSFRPVWSLHWWYHNEGAGRGSTLLWRLSLGDSIG